VALRSIVNEILANIQDRLTGVEERMVNVEERMGRVARGLSFLRGEVGELRTELFAFSSRVDDKFAVLMRGNEAVLRIFERMAETSASDGDKIRDYGRRNAALEEGNGGLG
jgi:hypothetical protein